MKKAHAVLEDPLLLQFAADKPDEMAAWLGLCDLGDLSELIESLPLESAASLAARLPSWQLTGLMSTLDADILAQILTTARNDDAVALVSHISESRYPSLLEAVSTEQRRELYELLEFPTHSVASLVSTGFIRVQDDIACGAFSEQLSKSTDTSARPVIVVDKEGKYRGILSLQAAYARKNHSRSVGEVAFAVDALNGLTDAATALSARQWLNYTVLPVVDGRHRVLGVVSRAALARVAGVSETLDFNFEKVVTELAAGYIETCAKVLESVLGKSK